ncbi:MAG: hypothetical protein Sapg2KO_35360 [Saprospiraceae bacterium]
MLRYLVWVIGFSLVLLACKTDLTNASIKPGTRINQSTQFDQDTISWDLTNKQAGLIIDTEKDLILDFQGAVLTGKSFGEQPDQHQGTAIKVVNAGKLHIKNADFRAFQQGIVVENVRQLIIEKCSFMHFYSEPINQPPKLRSSAVKVENAITINIEGVVFKQVDQGLQVQKAENLMINESSFGWLKEKTIHADQLAMLSISKSAFLYLGLPESQSKPININFSELELTLNNNSWAHVFQEDFEKFIWVQKQDQWSYLPAASEDSWNQKSIDEFLLDYGVTTPELLFLDEWGIYDHTYPKAWFRQTKNESDVFLLTAPPGNWRLIGGAGYDRVIPKTGTFPTTLKAEKTAGQASFLLEFEYLGKSARRFGKPYRSLEPLVFKGLKY